MLITKVHVEKFRGFHNQDFEVGSMLTAIAGQNGTQKSTLFSSESTYKKCLREE